MLVSEQRIMELESQLSAAQERIGDLTKANAELTAGLKAAEVAFKRVRRTARQDGNTLREQITTLQSRRF